MCDFAFHAAVLSEPSVWLSCKSRTGSAEGVLSQEVGEGGVARRVEKFCIISDSLRPFTTVPGVLRRIYEYYLVVLLALRGYGLLDGLEVGIASPSTILRYYDVT